MKCEKFKRLLSRSLDGELSVKERDLLDRHLSLCAACGEDYKWFKLGKQLLSTFETVEPQPDFLPRLMLSIEEIRGQSVWFQFETMAKKLLPALVMLIVLTLTTFVLLNPQWRGGSWDNFHALFGGAGVEDPLLTGQAEITADQVLYAIVEDK